VRRNKIFYIALSLAVSVLLIALLFSRIETHDFIQTLKNIHRPTLAAYAACALLGTALRAQRYKWLLVPKPIGWGPILLVTFIRNSLVDLLPARIGSLSYIYILNKRLGFSFETATSTFVLCFALDFLTLSPFLVAAVLAAGLSSNIISGEALLATSAVFFIIIFWVLWKIVPLSEWVLRKAGAIFRAFGRQDKRAVRVFEEKASAVIESFKAIRARKIGLPVFLLSLLIRLAKYVALFFLLFSLLRSHGFSPALPEFWKMILGTSGAELTSILPLKGLAGFGTWETAWALTYQLMNFDPRLAVLSGMGIHLITNLFEYSLGILSLVVLAFPYFKKARNQHDPL